MTKTFTIIAAAFTPFDAQGELAADRIPAQIQALVRDGADGAFICGTTGEGAALTTTERQRVAEAWTAAAPAGFEVIVHVGHASAAEARDLAAHAATVGATGIASVAPYFLKPRNAAEVVDALAIIAAGAPTVPFFYYHIPSVTGIAVPAAEIARLAIDRIPNFAGVKFTGDDLGDLGRVIDLCGDTRRVFFGRDDMLLPAMALGVRAAVGMTFNYTTPVARALVAAFDAHDLPEARRQQKSIRDLLGASAPYGLINGLKGVAAIVGVAVGPCRAPLLTLAKSEALDIAENLGLERALRPIAETAKRAA